METIVFNGRREGQSLKEELKNEALNKNFRPSLTAIVVGSNPGSLAYVQQKDRACQELGWTFNLVKLPERGTKEEVQNKIKELNKKPDVNGIILQLPLPNHLESHTVELVNAISPLKDIDGLYRWNPKEHTNYAIPPTAQAVIHILEKEQINIDESTAVVIGRGPTSGAPIAKLLSLKGANVFVIHSQTTKDEFLRLLSTADIIVSCVGKPNIVNGSMAKEGVAVIGVGISREISSSEQGTDSGSTVAPTTTIKGDIDEPSFYGKARLITPTPGGIGPLTVVFLLKNLLKLTELQNTDHKKS